MKLEFKLLRKKIIYNKIYKLKEKNANNQHASEARSHFNYKKLLTE